MLLLSVFIVILGIPLKILRSLDNNDGVEFLLEDGFIDACKKAQALQPATFEKPLNKTQNQFIIDYFNTTIFSGFNNKDFLKTIRYLDNENYVNKAPANVVDADRKKLKEEEEKLENLKSQIN